MVLWGELFFKKKKIKQTQNTKQINTKTIRAIRIIALLRARSHCSNKSSNKKKKKKKKNEHL